MHILVYEFVSGGGWHEMEPGRVPAASLLAEGRAMRCALASDMAAIDGATVSILHDARLPQPDLPLCQVVSIDSLQQERRVLARLAARADWTVVIAPELAGMLLLRCRLVEQSGGRLLGPGLAVVELASDKHLTAMHLSAHGVPVPEGRAIAAGESLTAPLALPAVIKPRDGAGSHHVRVLRRACDVPATVETPSRVERFCPGMAASVAVLCGPAGGIPLPPCRQRLSHDGRLTYLGGSLPLEPALARRATRLATRAVQTLRNPLGYLGVDLVLGPDEDGLDDVVIEINPRLTTSYVGLRAAARTNLGLAMLETAEGREPTLSFDESPIQFDASGTVRRA